MKKISCPETNCIELTCEVQFFMCFIFNLFSKSLNLCSNKKIKINFGVRLLMLMSYLDHCRIGNFASSRDAYRKDLVVFLKCIYSNNNVLGFHFLALSVNILINPQCTQGIDIASILIRHRKWEAIERLYGQKYDCQRSHS